MIRAYCRDHVAEICFSTKDYRPPTNAGECDATLSMKEWGHRKDMICYLDTEDGEKLSLCVEFSINSERCYRPPELPPGSILCATGKPPAHKVRQSADP